MTWKHGPVTTTSEKPSICDFYASTSAFLLSEIRPYSHHGVICYQKEAASIQSGLASRQRSGQENKRGQSGFVNGAQLSLHGCASYIRDISFANCLFLSIPRGVSTLANLIQTRLMAQSTQIYWEKKIIHNCKLDPATPESVQELLRHIPFGHSP